MGINLLLIATWRRGAQESHPKDTKSFPSTDVALLLPVLLYSDIFCQLRGKDISINTFNVSLLLLVLLDTESSLQAIMDSHGGELCILT